jgi:molecular chaperone HtpG
MSTIETKQAEQAEQEKAEQYSFEAEIPKLMNMIIHNFYSSKEIFLRELISNASDAINKAKYHKIHDSTGTNETNDQTDTESNSHILMDYAIKIVPNKETNTLTISDNGIGMTKSDLQKCLGTIAKSGTEEFVKQILNSANSANSANESSLIGQFGVGFYSAFLVADKVKVYTKHVHSKTVDNILVWESDAKSGYTITEIANNELNDFSTGTKIVLYLNQDQYEYLEEQKLTEIIKKHSGFSSYPILLLKRVKVEKPKPDNTADSKSLEDENEVEDIKVEDINENKVEDINENKVEDINENKVEDVKVEDVDEDKDKDKVEDKVEPVVDVYEDKFEKINTDPLWTKPSSQVTKEEYQGFYKSLSSDFDNYLTLKHFKAEGNIEFSAILFVPKRAPMDMFEQGKEKRNMKLHVKKVLITDNCKDLYPEYFNFIHGVVDSQDLPLNASRELLQQSKIIKQMNKILVKKTIEMLNDLATNEEKEYDIFYDAFGKNIKFAIHEDSANRSRLLELVRFKTTKSENKLVSLQSYIDRIDESNNNFNKSIYYITGNSLDNVEYSPFIDKLKKRNIEVILMTDPLDEYIMQHVTEFGEKKFVNVVKDEIKFDDDVSETEATNDSYKEICSKIQEVLGDKVDKVIVSYKIESQPAIVSSAMGWSATMEKIVKAQALANNQMMNYMKGRKVLEINPTHKIITKVVDSNYNPELVNVLFNLALLSGGYELEDTNQFLVKLYEIM